MKSIQNGKKLMPKKKDEPKSISTFSNGTEFEIWQDQNCVNCWKSYIVRSEKKENLKGSKCQLDWDLNEAYLGTGLIKESIARRLGWTPETKEISKDCPEREEYEPETKRASRRTKEHARRVKNSGQLTLDALNGEQSKA